MRCVQGKENQKWECCSLGMVFFNLVLLQSHVLLPFPFQLEAQKAKVTGWDKNNLLGTPMRWEEWTVAATILTTKVYKKESVSYTKPSPSLTWQNHSWSHPPQVLLPSSLNANELSPGNESLLPAPSNELGDIEYLPVLAVPPPSYCKINPVPATNRLGKKGKGRIKSLKHVGLYGYE